jgi:hypothetical protein
MFLRKKTLVYHEAVCAVRNKKEKLDAFEQNSIGTVRQSTRNRK